MVLGLSMMLKVILKPNCLLSFAMGSGFGDQQDQKL
jgi:hypothetical protein